MFNPIKRHDRCGKCGEEHSGLMRWCDEHNTLKLCKKCYDKKMDEKLK